MTPQPQINRVMQEKVCKQRTHDTPLRGSSITLNSITFDFHGRLQPSFDVQNDPWHSAVFAYRSQKEFMVNIIEEPLDRLPTTAVIWTAIPPK